MISSKNIHIMITYQYFFPNCAMVIHWSLLIVMVHSWCVIIKTYHMEKCHIVIHYVYLHIINCDNMSFMLLNRCETQRSEFDAFLAFWVKLGVPSNAFFQNFFESASKAKLIAQPFYHFACKKIGYINCIRWMLSIACFLWRTVDIMLWHTFRFEEYMAARYVCGSLLVTCHQYKLFFPFLCTSLYRRYAIFIVKCRIVYLYFLYFIMVWVINNIYWLLCLDSMRILILMYKVYSFMCGKLI